MSAADTPNGTIKRESSLRRLLPRQKSVEAFKQKHLPQLLELITEENWSGLRDYLNKGDVTSYPNKSLEAVDDSGQHLLHLLCRMRPPVDVVQKVVEAAPEGVKIVNARGQTPLHLAAAWGASPKVIRMLVNRYGDAATVQDSDGRTPLHLCCMDKTSGGPSSDEAEKWRMLEVVKALLSAAPDCVNDEDNDGMSVLEHALCGGNSDEVMLVLQKASHSSWKEQGKDDQVSKRKNKIQGAFQRFSRRASNEKEHWVSRMRDVPFDARVDVVDLVRRSDSKKGPEVMGGLKKEQVFRSTRGIEVPTI